MQLMNTTMWYSYLSSEGKTSARSAYSDLKKANGFVPGYKDVVKQINIAFKKALSTW